MTRSSLSAARIVAVNRGLPRIAASVRALTQHVRFLRSAATGGSADGRDLLRIVSDARVRALELRHSLLSLAEQAAAIRRGSLGPDVHGQFHGNLQGSLRNLSREFAKLESAIRDLDRVAGERINDPGRWSDSTAADPVSVLFSLLQNLMDIWRLERTRSKLG